MKNSSDGVSIKLPEQNELVIAVVKKILPYGAFCELPEYGNLESFIHVSEVAPRWIKNIHEFISEGQKHVAKIIRIDTAKNQVDISLKRVNEEERKRKMEAVRVDKKIEKILEVALASGKATLTVQEAKDLIEQKYEDAYTCFEEASEKGLDALEGIALPEAVKEKLVELVKKNVKKPIIEVEGIVKLTSYSADGVDALKRIIKEATKGNDSVKFHYLGAPNYKITLTAENFKDGEKALNTIIQRMEKLAKQEDCDFSFEKTK